MTAKFLITACDGGSDPQRIAMLARLVAMRGYSRAELALAASKVPYDTRASHNYGRGLNAADVERVVAESRKLRAMLDRMLTERQMFDVCAEFPEDLDPSQFGICGYDSMDRPFYRYAKSGTPQVHNPTPQLPEMSTVRTDPGGQGVDFNALATPPQGDSQKAA